MRIRALLSFWLSALAVERSVAPSSFLLDTDPVRHTLRITPGTARFHSLARCRIDIVDVRCALKFSSSRVNGKNTEAWPPGPAGGDDGGLSSRARELWTQRGGLPASTLCWRARRSPDVSRTDPLPRLTAALASSPRGHHSSVISSRRYRAWKPRRPVVENPGRCSAQPLRDTRETSGSVDETIGMRSSIKCLAGVRQLWIIEPKQNETEKWSG